MNPDRFKVVVELVYVENLVDTLVDSRVFRPDFKRKRAFHNAWKAHDIRDAVDRT